MADSKVVENRMDKLSIGINDFGLKLHVLLAEEKGNVFFSPFSISVALSMLYRGAKEETAAELANALGFKYAELNEKEVHATFDYLLTKLLGDQKSHVLSVANAIISQKEFALLSEYKTDLQNIYRALSMEVDFVRESADAVIKINNWVKENTKGKIQKIFDCLDPLTVIVLLNAVYFKGAWQNRFSTKATHDEMFYNYGIERSPVKVPMMNLRERVNFLEKENYKVLELPYVGDDIVMLLLLPSKKDGLSNLESSLNQDFLNTIRKELSKVRVHITIPKFHLEFSKELKPVLMKLGIITAFNKSANFKGLSESGQLSISQVLHKAVLDVNEEGSEATAVTGTRFVMKCGVRYEEFRADHPFLYMIYDQKNSLLLFMGRVEEL